MKYPTVRLQPVPHAPPSPVKPASLAQRTHLLVFGFYTLLILIIAWPVVTNLTIGTAGHFSIDRNQYLWNAWWFKRSVLETHTNPFLTDFLFYPYGINLYLHAYGPYNLVAGLPLQLLFGPIAAFNLLVLATFPLGAFGAYSLASYILREVPARSRLWGALLAGLVWSFGPYHFVTLRMEWLNLISLQWIPFFLLFLFKLEDTQERRHFWLYTGGAILFFVLTLLVDYYYALYSVMFVGLYWLWRVGRLLWQHRTQAGPTIAILTGKLALVLGTGLLIYSPLLFAVARETASGRYELGDTGDNQTHSTDLVQFFLPPAHNPLWGSQAAWWQSLGVKALNNFGDVISYLALALAIVALFGWARRRPDLWFWVGQALFWLILSAGPTLRLNGGATTLHLPYHWLVKLPVFDVWRFPERLLMMAQLSFGLLAAYGLVYLLERLPARRQVWLRPSLGGLILLLFLVESGPGILPSPDPISQPPFTQAIAASNAAAGVSPDKALLELPVTKHANPDSPRMLYQIFHDRPITGGYISRKPLDLQRIQHDYMLYDWFELRDPGPDIIPTKTAAELRGLLNFANMGFVVVYPDDFADNQERIAAANNLINLTLGDNGKPARPYYQDELATVYKVPTGQLNEPVMVLGQGWSGLETVDRKAGRYQRWLADDATEAHINIVVGPEVKLAQSYTLTLQAVSPDKARHMQILLNGQLVNDGSVQGLTSLTLPDLKLGLGDNILTIRADPADGVYIPAQAGGAANDNRHLRLGILEVKLQ